MNIKQGSYYRKNQIFNRRVEHEHIENGYCRLKMCLGRNMNYEIQAVKKIRKLAGYNVDILLDGSMTYDYESARRLAKVLERDNIFWFEEPFEPENLDAYAKLRKEVKVPIAAGENGNYSDMIFGKAN